MPPTIANNPEAKAKFEKLMSTIRQTYDELAEMDIPKEDAVVTFWLMLRKQKF